MVFRRRGGGESGDGDVDTDAGGFGDHAAVEEHGGAQTGPATGAACAAATLPRPAPGRSGDDGHRRMSAPPAPELAGRGDARTGPGAAYRLRAEQPAAAEPTSFDVQRTPTEYLGDPVPEIRHLARFTMEAFDGARPLMHLARWLTEDAYRDLQARVTLAARSRAVRAVAARRIRYVPGPVHRCDPAPGVVEACIVLHTPVRCRVLAVRLEGMDRRWRATTVTVL